MRLPPSTTFFALRAGADQVGLHSISTDTIPEGLRVTSRTDVDVPLPLVPRRILVTTEARYGPGLSLLAFTSTVSGETGHLTVTGSMADDTVLTLIATGRGLTTVDTVVRHLPIGAVLPDAVPLALAARGGLEPGKVTTIAVLDPLEGTFVPREFRARAESTFAVADSAIRDSASETWRPAGRADIPARRVEWSVAGLPVVGWVDRRGGLHRLQTPLGLTLDRSPFEIVNSGYTRRRPRNIQAAPLEVAVALPAPEGPTWVGLGPVDLAAVAAALSTPWQAVIRGGVATRAGPSPAAGGGRAADSVTAADRRPLASPRIKLESRRIAGQHATNPAAAVERLATWVASAIVPGTPSFGGAEATILRRRGDSSDRAELLVAMARALGIPARPVAGLLTSGGRPRYRAWAEVWLGSWQPVDPTLGQFPADGGHFRLLVHADARPATIVPLLGAIRPTLATDASATP